MSHVFPGSLTFLAWLALPLDHNQRFACWRSNGTKCPAIHNRTILVVAED
jgi:hypothetical protein